MGDLTFVWAVCHLSKRLEGMSIGGTISSWPLIYPWLHPPDANSPFMAAVFPGNQLQKCPAGRLSGLLKGGSHTLVCVWEGFYVPPIPT